MPALGGKNDHCAVSCLLPAPTVRHLPRPFPEKYQGTPQEGFSQLPAVNCNTVLFWNGSFLLPTPSSDSSDDAKQRSTINFTFGAEPRSIAVAFQLVQLASLDSFIQKVKQAAVFLYHGTICVHLSSKAPLPKAAGTNTARRSSRCSLGSPFPCRTQRL